MAAVNCQKISDVNQSAIAHYYPPNINKTVLRLTFWKFHSIAQ